ncbi:MAG: NAD(P)-dependent oxidoreductase [Pseudomonadota bacterium]
MSIGFVGAGTIGGPMAKQIAAQHPLMVFDIDAAAAGAVGGEVAGSLNEIGRACETVFLSLPGPPQIREVLLGDDGLIANGDAIKTIVDLSTNSVSLNREIAQSALEQGIQYLDAPVSGGKIAAEKGALAVMVGGDEGTFKAVTPLLECIGDHLFYMGPAGAGTLTKLVNNQIFLCATVLVQEGFVMGAKAGMDPSELLKVLNVSSAGPVLNRAPLMLSKKFDLGVFALSIAAKDVAVALQSADDLGVPMPMTQAASEVYSKAIENGLGGEDFFATVKVLESLADTELPALKKPEK